MILFNNKEECFGCGACANICYKNAITMVPDEKGFLYPEINESLCVNCMFCKASCQINHADEVKEDTAEKCYGFKNEDSIREKSSSGGAYTAISDYVLLDGGSCFGTAFTDTQDVVFQKAVNKQERDKFLGSKYVQSSIGTTYLEIGKELKGHNKVLFTGTPCQVSGLKHYLKAKKISTERLLTVDLLCHGTPSPKVWKDYVNFLEKKNQARMISYTFRDKEKGWIGYHIKAEYDNGNNECESSEELTFLKIFSMDVALRPSCYNCPYACRKRCGDITIGDYWGIHQLDEKFADNKGISLVVPNSSVGKNLVSSICENPLYRWNEYNYSSVSQPNLECSTLKNLVTDMFWKHYQTKGFMWIIRNYGGYNNPSFTNKIWRSMIYRVHVWRNKWRLG